MTVWDFFQTILFINLDSRPDRLGQINEELQRVGIENTTRIPGVLMDNRPMGFNQAQHNALEAAKGITLILEDDVVFPDYSHLEAALYELPEDWDLLYLGANIQGTDLCSWPAPGHYSQHLKRVSQAWTTHAIAYSEAGAKKILDRWDYKHDQIFDDFLRCNLENLQAFIVNPQVADQRPGYSDIWRTPVNYGMFKGGNDLMART